MADSFRMQLTSHRERALDRACETFNETTRSKAVTLACEHGRLDAQAKRDALQELAGEVDVATLVEIARILSTRTMPIELDLGLEAGEPRVDVKIGRQE